MFCGFGSVASSYVSWMSLGFGVFSFTVNAMDVACMVVLGLGSLVRVLGGFGLCWLLWCFGCDFLVWGWFAKVCGGSLGFDLVEFDCARWFVCLRIGCLVILSWRVLCALVWVIWVGCGGLWVLWVLCLRCFGVWVDCCALLVMWVGGGLGALRCSLVC